MRITGTGTLPRGWTNLSRIRYRHVSWIASALAGTILLLLLMVWQLFPLTVDDAYISYHYADNLVQGHGLVWHPGTDPVEGYTNFLWVVLLAFVIRLGADVIVMAKVLGIFFSVGGIVMMIRVTRLLDGPGFNIVPAMLFASSPILALWSVSGLETTLFVFLLLTSLWQFLSEELSRSEPSQRYWSPLWLLLLGLTRPEGAVLFVVLTIARLFLWMRRGIPRERIVGYLRWVAFFGIFGLAYFVWRWSYFGYPLPNTFYVKANSELSGVARQIGVYLIPYALRLAPLILLALFALGDDDLQRGDHFLGIALATLLLLNFASSDWMPAHRLAFPMTPLILLLARKPLERIFQSIVHADSWRRRLTYLTALLALILFMSAPFFYTTNIYHRVMATQMDMSIYRWADEMGGIVEGQYVAVGKWLAENAPPECRVVAGNVGAIAYFSHCEVIDQIGLTNEHIARNGWTVSELLATRPDYIVIESDTSQGFGGLYGTGGERWAKNTTFKSDYELVLLLENGKRDEPALFIHYLPHATWLFAHKDVRVP